MIVILALLLLIAFSTLAYIVGATRNSRRPLKNHQHMFLLLRSLVEQDKNFPLLAKADRDRAEELIDDYINLPDPKEVH